MRCSLDSYPAVCIFRSLQDPEERSTVSGPKSVLNKDIFRIENSCEVGAITLRGVVSGLSCLVVKDLQTPHACAANSYLPTLQSLEHVRKPK